MSKPWSHKVIALLALIQGVFGLLRAYNWVQIGTNLFGQGLLLLPFVGAVAVMRGLFVSLVALLYVLFAVVAYLVETKKLFDPVTTEQAVATSTIGLAKV
jgi:hypothetical protein